MHTQIWSREGTNFMEFRKVIYDFVLKNHGSYLVSHFQRERIQKIYNELIAYVWKIVSEPLNV